MSGTGLEVGRASSWEENMNMWWEMQKNPCYLFDKFLFLTRTCISLSLPQSLQLGWCRRHVKELLYFHVEFHEAGWGFREAEGGELTDSEGPTGPTISLRISRSGWSCGTSCCPMPMRSPALTFLNMKNRAIASLLSSKFLAKFLCPDLELCKEGILGNAVLASLSYHSTKPPDFPSCLPGTHSP